MLISRVVSIVIVTVVTIATTDFLTSVWTLTSVQRVGLTAISASILKEVSVVSAMKAMLPLTMKLVVRISMNVQ